MYTTHKLVVSNGLSRIYLGKSTDDPSGITFVIKVIKITPKTAQDIQEEIESLKLLSSEPNNHVVKYVDNYQFPSDTYQFHCIVMEDLTKWITLDRYIRNFLYNGSRKRFPPKLLKSLMTQLLIGLEYIHSKGVAHRDIKPDNIMISDDYHIKYIDFGLSSCKEFTGNKGTPIYFPPEIPVFATDDRNPPKNLNPEQAFEFFRTKYQKHDIWSLGVVFYQLSNVPDYPTFPFDVPESGDIFNFMKILRKNHIKYPPSYLYEYGYDGLDFNELISMMLCFDFQNRPTCSSLLDFVRKYP